VLPAGRTASNAQRDQSALRSPMQCPLMAATRVFFAPWARWPGSVVFASGSCCVDWPAARRVTGPGLSIQYLADGAGAAAASGRDWRVADLLTMATGRSSGARA